MCSHHCLPTFHSVDPMVAAGPVVFPFEQANDTLPVYREFCKTCPGQLTVWAIIRDAPPLPFLPEAVHGSRVLILAPLYSGDTKEGMLQLAKSLIVWVPNYQKIPPSDAL